MASPGPDSADSTARLLALVLERAPRTPDDLRAALGLVEPEFAPLLAALERHGLVAWDAASGRVRPGPAALRFARTEVARGDLIEHAAASMRRLADESGETVNLMVPTPGGTEAIAQQDGRHLLGATNWLGRDIPDHASAAGKVFLAFGVSEIAARLERMTDAHDRRPAGARGRPRGRAAARLRDARRRARARAVRRRGAGVRRGRRGRRRARRLRARRPASPRHRLGAPGPRRDRAGARRLRAPRLPRRARGRPRLTPGRAPATAQIVAASATAAARERAARTAWLSVGTS